MNPNPPSCGWKWSLAGLVTLVAAVRASILFATPLVPGMNGAYYLVQARSVLARGTLGIPDLPLTFYLQAAVAWLVRTLSGWQPEPSILLAVKLSDALFPALVVVPVALLVLRWSRRAGAPDWLALAAGAAAALNAPLLGMAGDFQKNSLGFVWLAALLYALQLWTEDPSARRAVAVVAFWGLAGLTHIAVFGASLLLGGLALVFFRTSRRFSWRALWPLLLAAGAVLLLAAGLVLWKFDPGRIGKLAQALAHPASYLTGEGLRGGPGGGGGGPPGGMPGAGRLLGSSFLLVLVAALAACRAGWPLWRRGEGQWCLPVACALGAVVLTGPWVQGDKTERFGLLAVVPAVLAAAFALIHWPRPRLRAGLAGALVLALAVSGWETLSRGGRGIVNEAAVRELQAMAPLIPHPEKTLVCARHGLEWWAAWTLHTHIAQPSALQASDWQRFESVCFLKSSGQSGEGRPPMGGGPPGAGWLRRIGFSQPGPPPGGGFHGGPPPFPGGPGGNGGPGGPPPGGAGGPGGPGGPGGGSPMSDPEIPSDAEPLHQGAHFTLARVPSAPEFVTHPAQSWK
ncbi:MAG: hypothetical protein ACFUZC_20065 [Chthoniobacteraceae bacterium]